MSNHLLTNSLVFKWLRTPLETYHPLSLRTPSFIFHFIDGRRRSLPEYCPKTQQPPPCRHMHISLHTNGGGLGAGPESPQLSQAHQRLTVPSPHGFAGPRARHGDLWCGPACWQPRYHQHFLYFSFGGQCQPSPPKTMRQATQSHSADHQRSFLDWIVHRSIV